MDMFLRPANPTELLYLQQQNQKIAEKCGSPGYLWGELDNDVSFFLHGWENFIESRNTPEFKAEFKTVLEMLRFDERYGNMLKNHTTMVAYCIGNGEGRFRNGFEYAFRAEIGRAHV